MLTSLDINGEVPEVGIWVAGFGLGEADRHMLRSGAGALGRRLEFLDVTEEMLQDVDRGGYTGVWSVATLGRLFLPYQVITPGARLLSLDSDMIVNASLRPLFELDLQGRYFAAVHDYPRADDPTYFNAGMSLIDVDGYVEHDVGRRSLRWLNQQHPAPKWLDQDAMNAIVGDDWSRLDRTWNYFDGPHAPTGDFEAARIAHFAAHPKPWDQTTHAGRPIYTRYLAALRARLSGLGGVVAKRDLIATCYEVFLGRDVKDDQVVAERGRWAASEIIRSVVDCGEFADNALRWVEDGARPPAHMFPDPPTTRQKFWAADIPELSAAASTAVLATSTWPELLAILLADEAFRTAYGPTPRGGTEEA